MPDKLMNPPGYLKELNEIHSESVKTECPDSYEVLATIKTLKTY